ncbi:GxxExxY protein [Flaviaesturariibacter amylovorans]|uniref:GxxExxY protein n=1 Tax=Flaviaesturariibacter amylovorans TaxID=1084520 RepID=A0ABP8GVY0_9BACT
MEHDIEKIGKAILDAAITVHKALGPGLLESAYKIALEHELTLRGFGVRREVPVQLVYKGVNAGKGFRMDMLVNDLVIVEAKAVQELHPIDLSQLLTHLRLYDRRLGYLINFNVTLFKDGFKRVVNNWHYQNT